MSRSIENLISKCMESGVSREIIREIEEELPDVHHVRSNLMNDLRRSGIKFESIDSDGYSICVNAEKTSELMTVIDTYNRTYSEIEVYAA